MLQQALQIRRPELSDAHAVVGMMQAAHPHSEWADRTLSVPRMYAAYDALWHDANACMLVSVDVRGEIVGIIVGTLEASYFTDDIDAVQTLLYTDPLHRSFLHVQALVTAFERWAAEQGAAAVRMGVSQLADGARVSALFGRMGYKLCDFSHRKVLL